MEHGCLSPSPSLLATGLRGGPWVSESVAPERLSPQSDGPLAAFRRQSCGTLEQLTNQGICLCCTACPCALAWRSHGDQAGDNLVDRQYVGVIEHHPSCPCTAVEWTAAEKPDQPGDIMTRELIQCCRRVEWKTPRPQAVV